MQRTERDQRAPLRRFTYSRRGYDVTEVDRYVAEIDRQFEAGRHRIEQLERALQQLNDENASLTQMINHMARLGEQLVADARKEAHDIVAAARTEPPERIVVTASDTPGSVSDARHRAADELEMLAVVRETIVAERDALLEFHGELSSRLRALVASIVEHSADDGIRALAASRRFDEPEPPPAPVDESAPSEPRQPSDVAEGATGSELPAPAPAIVPVPTLLDEPHEEPHEQPHEEPHEEPHDPFADEHFDRAFSSFMGSESDVEPSRRWMISGE
jgi:cell division septum initiation protein DivIVA